MNRWMTAIALTIFAVLAVSMVGCGNNGQGNDTSAPTLSETLTPEASGLQQGETLPDWVASYGIADAQKAEIDAVSAVGGGP